MTNKKIKKTDPIIEAIMFIIKDYTKKTQEIRDLKNIIDQKNIAISSLEEDREYFKKQIKNDLANPNRKDILKQDYSWVIECPRCKYRI